MLSEKQRNNFSYKMPSYSHFILKQSAIIYIAIYILQVYLIIILRVFFFCKATSPEATYNLKDEELEIMLKLDCTTFNHFVFLLKYRRFIDKEQLIKLHLRMQKPLHSQIHQLNSRYYYYAVLGFAFVHIYLKDIENHLRT